MHISLNSKKEKKKTKEKHLAREQGNRKEKTEVQTKDHTQKCKMHNKEPWKEKIWNLRLEPITSNTKQVVQGDGWKTWKDIKFKISFSCCYNCPTQDNS